MMSERLASVSRSSRQTLGEDDMEVPVRTTASRLLTRRNATVPGLRACLPSDESRSDVTVLARRLGAPVGELRARLLADRPPARPLASTVRSLLKQRLPRVGVYDRGCTPAPPPVIFNEHRQG